MQKLMTKAISKKIPAIYAQDGKGMNAVAYVKFFVPWGAGTFFGTEFDAESGTFFGWVSMAPSLDQGELGYFSLAELEAIKGPFGLKIERDIHFTPTKLSEIPGLEGKAAQLAAVA